MSEKEDNNVVVLNRMDRYIELFALRSNKIYSAEYYESSRFGRVLSLIDSRIQ